MSATGNSKTADLTQHAGQLLLRSISENLAERMAEELSDVQPVQQPILVACSGGRDSMALAWAAHEFLNRPVEVAIINHQLQEGSREVAQVTAKRCAQFGIQKTHIIDINVAKTRAGVEADAREARYDALVQLAHERSAAAVLVAHTQDDVAETVLMRILRSPSIDALTGISRTVERDGVTFLRPWLELTREDTTALCAAHGIEYWDDPTNGDDISGLLGESYPERSRMRHDVIPLLDEVTGRDVRAVLARAAQVNAEDLAIINEKIDEAYSAIIRIKNGVREIKIRPLRKFSPAVQRRVVYKALIDEQIHPRAAMISDILQLSGIEQKKKSVRICSALRANKVYDVIQLWKDR